MYHLRTPVGVFWIEPSTTPPQRWLLCFAPADGSAMKSWPYKTMSGAAAAVRERRTGIPEWDGAPRQPGEPDGLSGWTRGPPPPIV